MISHIYNLKLINNSGLELRSSKEDYNQSSSAKDSESIIFSSFWQTGIWSDPPQHNYESRWKNKRTSFFVLFSHFAFSSNSKKSLILIAPNFPLFVSRLEAKRAQARARRPEDSKTWEQHLAHSKWGSGFSSKRPKFPNACLSSDLAQRPITSNFFI